MAIHTGIRIREPLPNICLYYIAALKSSRPSLPLKKAFFEFLRLPLAKGSSTFLTKPLFPQEREDVTALRCSEPLRYKVGGPIKGLARLCGMGPPNYDLS